jgi:hypothetical protein
MEIPDYLTEGIFLLRKIHVHFLIVKTLFKHCPAESYRSIAFGVPNIQSTDISKPIGVPKTPNRVKTAPLHKSAGIVQLAVQESIDALK